MHYRVVHTCIIGWYIHAVCLILNGKGINRMWSPWDRSCFQQVNLLLFLNKTFLLFQVLFLFVCFVVSVYRVEQWRRRGGLHQVCADEWRFC